MNLFATANHQIKANVRNEAPENSLGDREGQGDEDYSQKTGQALFNFPEINLADAFEHRRAHEQQDRRGRICRTMPASQAMNKQGKKTESGEDRRQTRASAAIYARDAFNVGSS